MLDNKEKELEILPINEGKSIEKEFAEMRFQEKINDPDQIYAVHGLMQFDPSEGKLVLKNKTDLDGMGALEILRIAGAEIKDENIIYVKPGEFVTGAINVDTGCKLGFDYSADNDTVIFDHHSDDAGNNTSATQEAYTSLVEMKLIEKNETLDRTVDFITKIDNRKFEAEEFLRSGKTILGLQRDLDFSKLFLYFSEHENPCEELTPTEFKEYGLEEAALKQQKLVDESMSTLETMENEGKVFDSEFGSILINVNNELKAGSSAAYVNHDGIINFTPEKSFAVTLKDAKFDQEKLESRLGEKFVGKIIRGNMWIYNDEEKMNLMVDDLINSIKKVEVENRLKTYEIRQCIDADLLDGIAPVINGFLEKNNPAVDKEMHKRLSDLVESIEERELKWRNKYWKADHGSKAANKAIDALDDQQFDDINDLIDCFKQSDENSQNILDDFLRYCVKTRKNDYMKSRINSGLLDYDTWDYYKNIIGMDSYGQSGFEGFILNMIKLGFIEESEYESLKQRGYFEDKPLFSDKKL